MYSSLLGLPKKDSNLLHFTPPGFPCSIDVLFPGRLLPVCDKCKKNFKTREHCRARECHTSLPWSEVFVCVTLDPSCTNEDNALAPGPFIARPVPAQPLLYSGNIEPDANICSICKDKNYTRSHCRASKKHRQVPWNTVFVILSYDPNAQIPDTSDAVRKKLTRSKRRKVADEAGDDADLTEETGASTTQSNVAPGSLSFFDAIPRSRSFLCSVSSASSSLQWLEYDTGLVNPFHPAFRDVPPMGAMPFFGYGLPPPYMGTGDMYPSMPPMTMFDGKGPFPTAPRDFPPYRDYPDQMAMMMGDFPPPHDPRMYSMGPPPPFSHHPEMFEQYNPRVGRIGSSAHDDDPNDSNRGRPSVTQNRSFMDPHSLYGPGDGVSPRLYPGHHLPPSPWNGNPHNSYWNESYPPPPQQQQQQQSKPLNAAYPEASAVKDDDSGSRESGDDDSGKPLHL